MPEGWDVVGEGVGFFKCGAEAGPAFVRFLEQVIEESQGMNEYEDALHMLVTAHHVGWVDVTGLRWTEIDFAEDLRRAEADVLPPVLVADGAVVHVLAALLAAGAPVAAELARRGVASEVDERCVVARNAAGLAAAERRLHDLLRSPIDTNLDVQLHRRFSRYVTRAAIALGVTPNTITVVSTILGLAAVWCFWRATTRSALAGLFIYIVAVILDHSDGEVARLTLAESRVGEWLDTVGDTLVHALTVVAMGVTSEMLTGVGVGLGIVGAAGIMASAFVAKWWPPRGTGGMGGAVEDFGS